MKISIQTIVAGLVLRMVLLCKGQTREVSISAEQWCQILLLGSMNVLCAETISFSFLWLFMLSDSESKYRIT